MGKAAGLAASGVVLAGSANIPHTCEAREWGRGADLGVFVNFHFGGSHGGAIGVGIEGRGLFVDTATKCDSAQQLFLGGVARIEAVDWRDMRLTLGPTLGSTNGNFGYAGEVAMGVALGSDPGLVAQLGAELEGGLLFNARAAYALGRDAHVGLGIRVPPLSTSGLCVTGRPLRRGDGLCQTAGAVVIGPPSDGDNVRAARVWLQRARLEWGSAPAFCELAEQLEACGAPEELAGRARRAAEDELRHAALSIALSARLMGALYVSLDPPVTDHRPVARGREGLCRLAFESWNDGCLGEGAAAEQALLSGYGADDPAIRQTQLMIAGDEAKHSQLAWDVLEWAMTADRDRLRHFLPLTSPVGRDGAPMGVGTLKQFGIMDVTQANDIRRECDGLARERLSARLRA